MERRHADPPGGPSTGLPAPAGGHGVVPLLRRPPEARYCDPGRRKVHAKRAPSLHWLHAKVDARVAVCPHSTASAGLRSNFPNGEEIATAVAEKLRIAPRYRRDHQGVLNATPAVALVLQEA